MFGARGLSEVPQVFDDLRTAFGQSVLVGCPTSGEIAGALVHDRSLSVAVARFEPTRLALAVADIAPAEASGAAGQRLAAQLCAAGPDLSAVIVLSDGLDANGTALVAGRADSQPVTGGLAGDGSDFGRTGVLAGARPLQDLPG